EESFLMYLGDNLSGGGIEGILHTFESTKADATLMVKEVSNPQQFGVAEIGLSGGINRLVEKPENPRSNLAIIGTYCFSSMIHQATSSIVPSKRGELEITDAIQYLLENGGIVNAESQDSWWFDCGTKDDLLEANKTILDQSKSGLVEGNISEDSNIHGQVEIGAGTRVTNSQIIGPVKIGNNSTIANSLIGSETSIGSECKINNSTIRRTILMDYGTIDNVTQVENSVIGKNSNVISHSEFVGNIQFMVGDDSEILL
ncbi:sugar phosphate nucleotidyltransferase, partial [Dehalococcoidia bacterium]|nr:sugar phosphate nucleotidyltransferase [Dehalococcoidia bacterium]